jgi:hypothetical protein
MPTARVSRSLFLPTSVVSPAVCRTWRRLFLRKVPRSSTV